MFSAGLEGRFEVALVSGSLGVEKPDPAIFNMALETMQISSEEAVYVGDQWVNDVQGALSAGLKAIWIHEQPADRELPDGLIRISRLSELEDALKF